MISSDFAVSLLSRLLHYSDRITVIGNYDHKEIRLRVPWSFSDTTEAHLPGQHSSPAEGAFLHLLWAIYLYSFLSKVYISLQPL